MTEESERVKECLTIDFCIRCVRMYDANDDATCEKCHKLPVPHDISLALIQKAAKRSRQQRRMQFEELQRVDDIGGIKNKFALPRMRQCVFSCFGLTGTDIAKFTVLVDTGPWEPDNCFYPPGNGLAEGLFQNLVSNCQFSTIRLNNEK